MADGRQPLFPDTHMNWRQSERGYTFVNHQPLFPDTHMNWRQSERGYTFVKISYTCSTLESLSFMKLGIIEGDAKVLCERQV